jgi:5-oxoprolinase (ATP-hydrolysing)
VTHRVGVDVGGTFTDLVSVTPDGTLRFAKVPSVPADPSDAVLAVLDAAGLRPADVAHFAHGTTVATNALLERRGGRTALVTTRGFRDVIEIGRQDRPALYDLTRDRPSPLVSRADRFTLAERCGPDGVLVPLEESQVREVARELAAVDGLAGVAVCLLFSFAWPEHERRVAAILREQLPGVLVVGSSEVLPQLREYERFATTVADAYLAPKLASYLTRLSDRAGAAGFPLPLVMQSSGGVTDLGAAASRAAACVLSGPAAGVVGAAYVAGLSGEDDVLTFDMGGTSTDVAAVLGGQVTMTTSSLVGGVPIMLPSVDVHSVSAGGGSIAWVDSGGALRVGPTSAGADPGPACYGRGGQAPTVTDADLVLGHLADGAVFGGRVRLSLAGAEQALRALGERLGMTALEAADGVVKVADAQMAKALRVVSVERGLDPRGLALVAFGGAGGMHACALAEDLGCPRVLVPLAGGVLSALGLAVGDLRRDYVLPVIGRLTEIALDPAYDAMTQQAAVDLPGGQHARYADCRYAGQSHELTVPCATDPVRSNGATDVAGLRAAFESLHARRYGYHLPDEEIEVVAARLVATVPGRRPGLSAPPADRDARSSRRPVLLDGAWTDVQVVPRAGLGPGEELDGPCVVEFAEATCLVRPGWSGHVDQVGTLVLEPASGAGVRTRPGRDVPHGGAEVSGTDGTGTGGTGLQVSGMDPVTLSVLNSTLTGIAEEMGTILVRGAFSSNIKERRDCSAALFDPQARMVAQAAHVPVHLGAMYESVRQVAARDPEPGDVWVLNDPFCGGNHLPDITLVSPLDLGGERIGYAATRAHHSDVGGMRPGSMPADSQEIYAEGLIIPPVRLVTRGTWVDDVLDLICANSRTPRLRRGDLQAQVAAGQLASRRLGEVAGRYGRDVVVAAFEAVLDYGRRRSRAFVAGLPDGSYHARTEIEGDSVTDADLPIQVTVTIAGETLEIDFTGTSPAVRGNVNCPLAVTRSACCFALRVLLPDDVPANDGTYEVLRLVTEPGSLVHARRPSAVVAGNVETSQRIADVVLDALRGAVGSAMAVPAQGQGTMNNLVIGGVGWTYYETLGGGQGASAAGPGPSGVHVGMTNTLNTPIEALELEYPLRVERYELDLTTAGPGLHPGGSGLIRSVRVLTDASVSVLADRRRHAPQGAEGGGPGGVGRTDVDGQEIPPKASLRLDAGSVITVRTPGGGGWGAPAPSAG